MSIEAILVQARARKLLPTRMSSRELLTLSADVRAASVFSAKVSNARHLGVFADVMDRIISGEINTAKGRELMRESLAVIGYSTERGFPESGEEWEPVKPGSVQDHSSTRRINLQIDTTSEMYFGKARKDSALERVESWPFWELIRARIPAGAPRNWPERWEAVGGVLQKGKRMIAHKLDPIWRELGSSENFDDALDVDHEPFAFNSGMIRSELRLKDVVGMDIVVYDVEGNEVEDSDITPRAAVTYLAPDLVEALKRDLAMELKGTELLYQQEQDASRKAYLEKHADVADVLIQGEAESKERRAMGNRAVQNAGTSEGARKGWITRKRGGGGGIATKARADRKAIGEAHAEIEKVLRQGGRYEGKIKVPGVGEVRLPYGRAGHWSPNEKGATHTDGYGLSHIRQKHGAQAVKSLPETLIKGKRGPWYEERGILKREFRNGPHIATISKKRGEPIVLTGYRDGAVSLKKSDKKARMENKAARLPSRPAGLTRKMGSGTLTPGPTHADLVNSPSHAGASKNSTIKRQRREVKP